MLSWKRYIAVLVVIFVGLPLIRWCAFPESDDDCRAGPKKISEVIRIASRLGLHWRSDRLDESVASRRIFVSERPVTWERINELGLPGTNKGEWLGTVAVYHRAWKDDNVLTDVIVMNNMVIWGEFAMMGDLKLILKMIEFHGANEDPAPTANAR